MNILFFAGALRKESFNKKFAREAMRLANEAGMNGEFLDLKDYAMPVYDGDIQDASGIPDATKKLGEKIRAADALVIATPEYNGSMPGILKNVIDWLSREKPMSLNDKHLLLLAASPGALGGLRALYHSRHIYEALGMHVYPNMLSLPGADKAFDAQGKLNEPAMVEKLQKLLGQFFAHVKK